MSRLFFKDRIERIIPLIKEGDLSAAEVELTLHINSTAEDLSEDEFAFRKLVNCGHEYLGLLQEIKHRLRKAKEQQLDKAPEALEPANQALEKGRELVRLAHKVQRLTKKEALKLEQLIEKLNRRLGGLKGMTKLPDLLVVVDVRREAIAVKEGNILNVPVLAMVDTNCDPDPIDLVIPSNDDAIRAIKLMVTQMSAAVNEGLQIRMAVQADEEVEEDEKYLGAATLAKLRSGDFADEDEIDDDDLYTDEDLED